MALSQFQTIPNLGADPEFRNFVAAYRAALSAAGFIRTSDTGQIDPATVVKPAASGIGGYEIWRFNDSAQATKPIFFKLEYAVGASVARLTLWITIGTGSDGVGNITGVRIARNSLGYGTTTATLQDVWVAGGEGYLTSGVYVGPTTGSTAIGWFIERTRLPSGLVDVSSDGAGIVYATIASGTFWNAISYDGVWSELSIDDWPTINSGGAFQYRGTTYAYPYYPIIGTMRAPSRAVVCSASADIGITAPFTVSLYGVPHTFRGVVGSNTNYGRGPNATPGFRYE